MGQATSDGTGKRGLKQINTLRSVALVADRLRIGAEFIDRNRV
jgi:hypothetical protein